MSQRNYQLVRYKVNRNNFEVMVNPGAVMKYRKKTITDIQEVIYSDVIYKNQSKAEQASEADLSQGFETEDVMACIEIILQKGEVQLTSAERKAKVEKKRLEIINFIHQNYVDPASKKPIPVVRIENALETMKFKPDGNIPTDKQLAKLLKKLPEYIPLKKMIMSGALTIPNKYIGQAQNVVHKYCETGKESWGNAWTVEVSIVPGVYDNFIRDISSATQGEFNFNIDGQQSNDNSNNNNNNNNNRNKGKKGKKGKKRNR
eukprot:TRINITY_DN3635_c1_g1_i1.p1 TRINITY_DN3635_c1_g1~~TRINITY_DN3635_c1_g1_i1.p1  ORF type:complete len:260 (+),score=83.05 TRINITY_DN3635_c1_g1_i1:75-854(+)